MASRSPRQTLSSKVFMYEVFTVIQQQAGDLQSLRPPQPPLTTVTGVALGIYKPGQPYRRTSVPIRVPRRYPTGLLGAGDQLVDAGCVIFEVAKTWLCPKHSKPALGFVNGEQGIG